MNKELLLLSLKRAIWTFLQVVLSMITVGAAIQDIDWFNIVSIAATAFVYSFIKSVILGVPEAERDGTIIIDDSDEDTTKWLFQFKEGTDVDAVTSKKSVSFKIQNGITEEKK